jgi:hypothetical protein
MAGGDRRSGFQQRLSTSVNCFPVLSVSYRRRRLTLGRSRNTLFREFAVPEAQFPRMLYTGSLLSENASSRQLGE